MNEAGYPLDRKALREEYDEVLLKMALADYMERRSAEETERLRALPEPPCHVDFAGVVDREQSKGQRRETWGRVLHMTGKVVTKVAVVFLVLALSFTTAFAASPKVREAVFKLAYRQYDEYTEIFPSEEDFPEFIDADKYTAEHCYALTYLPEGWVLTDASDALSICMTYEKGDAYLDFTQAAPETHWGQRVDSEDADAVFTTMIGDSEAFCCIKEGDTSISWQEDGWLLSIYARLDYEEALKVAQGVRKMR